MDAVLQVKHLKKSFGKRPVIKDISFDVYAGEVFGFLGPNGAGKTTTIKMVMGFLSLDDGEIIINHTNIRDHYEKAMSNLGGIVENPEMYRDLSGRMNLEMYARLHDGVTKERVSEVIEMVGMTARIEEKVKRYSLGMKQRVGLAQALVHRPKVLILDEPTNGLDPVGIRELRDILKKLAHEQNVAVIVSSHMLSEMELMCDRVGIIQNGVLLGVKPVEDLMNQASGASLYRFLVKQGEQVVSHLPDNRRAQVRSVTEEYVELEVLYEEVPEINALLVQHDIPVYGIHKTENSLEEAFLAITGGGNTIA